MNDNFSEKTSPVTFNFKFVFPLYSTYLHGGNWNYKLLKRLVHSFGNRRFRALRMNKSIFRFYAVLML